MELRWSYDGVTVGFEGFCTSRPMPQGCLCFPVRRCGEMEMGLLCGQEPATEATMKERNTMCQTTI
jgi:hypothetical protein